MGQLQQIGSLEIDQDLEFEQRQSRIQRIAWVAILVFLLASVLGLFGKGPLSRTLASAGPLALEYDRFVRRDAPSKLHLQIEPVETDEGQIAVWLEHEYADLIEIERVLPEPVEMVAEADRIIFRFAVEDPVQPAEMTFAIEPDELGTAQGRLGIVGGEEIRFDTFIFP